MKSQLAEHRTSLSQPTCSSRPDRLGILPIAELWFGTLCRETCRCTMDGSCTGSQAPSTSPRAWRISARETLRSGQDHDDERTSHRLGLRCSSLSICGIHLSRARQWSGMHVLVASTRCAMLAGLVQYELRRRCHNKHAILPCHPLMTLRRPFIEDQPWFSYQRERMVGKTIEIGRCRRPEY